MYAIFKTKEKALKNRNGMIVKVKTMDNKPITEKDELENITMVRAVFRDGYRAYVFPGELIMVSTDAVRGVLAYLKQVNEKNKTDIEMRIRFEDFCMADDAVITTERADTLLGSALAEFQFRHGDVIEYASEHTIWKSHAMIQDMKEQGLITKTTENLLHDFLEGIYPDIEKRKTVVMKDILNPANYECDTPGQAEECIAKKLASVLNGKHVLEMSGVRWIRIRYSARHGVDVYPPQHGMKMRYVMYIQNDMCDITRCIHLPDIENNTVEEFRERLYAAVKKEINTICDELRALNMPHLQ